MKNSTSKKARPNETQPAEPPHDATGAATAASEATGHSRDRCSAALAELDEALIGINNELLAARKRARRPERRGGLMVEMWNVRNAQREVSKIRELLIAILPEGPASNTEVRHARAE